MVRKGQWVVLTYSVDMELPGTKLRPPRVKEEREWRPRWIRNYSYSNINSYSFPISTLNVVKYGRDLDLFIREVMIANPTLGPLYELK